MGLRNPEKAARKQNSKSLTLLTARSLSSINPPPPPHQYSKTQTKTWSGKVVSLDPNSDCMLRPYASLSAASRASHFYGPRTTDQGVFTPTTEEEPA